MLIKVELCAACAEKLRVIVAERGEESMARAVGPIISKCATCRPQLPGYKLGKVLNTKLKRRLR